MPFSTMKDVCLESAAEGLTQKNGDSSGKDDLATTHRPSSMFGQNISNGDGKESTLPPTRLFGQAVSENSEQSLTITSKGTDQTIAENGYQSSMSKSDDTEQAVPQNGEQSFASHLYNIPESVSKTVEPSPTPQANGVFDQAKSKTSEQVSYQKPPGLCAYRYPGLIVSSQPSEIIENTSYQIAEQAFTSQTRQSVQSIPKQAEQVSEREPTGQLENICPNGDNGLTSRLNGTLERAISRNMEQFFNFRLPGVSGEPCSINDGQVPVLQPEQSERNTLTSNPPRESGQTAFKNTGQYFRKQSPGFLGKPMSGNPDFVSEPKLSGNQSLALLLQGQFGETSSTKSEQFPLLRPPRLFGQATSQNTEQAFSSNPPGTFKEPFSKNSNQTWKSQSNGVLQKTLSKTGEQSLTLPCGPTEKATVQNAEQVFTPHPPKIFRESTSRNGGNVAPSQQLGAFGQNISITAGQSLHSGASRLCEQTMSQSTQQSLTSQATGVLGRFVSENGGQNQTQGTSGIFELAISKNSTAGSAPQTTGSCGQSSYQTHEQSLKVKPLEALEQTISKTVGQVAKSRQHALSGHGISNPNEQFSTVQQNGQLGQTFSGSAGHLTTSQRIYKNAGEVCTPRPNGLFDKPFSENAAQGSTAKNISTNSEGVPNFEQSEQMDIENDGQCLTSLPSGMLAQTSSTTIEQNVNLKPHEKIEQLDSRNAEQIVKSISNGQPMSNNDTEASILQPPRLFVQNVSNIDQSLTSQASRPIGLALAINAGQASSTQTSGPFGRNFSTHAEEVVKKLPPGQPGQPMSKNAGQVSTLQPSGSSSSQTAGQNLKLLPCNKLGWPLSRKFISQHYAMGGQNVSQHDRKKAKEQASYTSVSMSQPPRQQDATTSRSAGQSPLPQAPGAAGRTSSQSAGRGSSEQPSVLFRQMASTNEAQDLATPPPQQLGQTASSTDKQEFTQQQPHLFGENKNLTAKHVSSLRSQEQSKDIVRQRASNNDGENLNSQQPALFAHSKFQKCGPASALLSIGQYGQQISQRGGQAPTSQQTDLFGQTPSRNEQPCFPIQTAAAHPLSQHAGQMSTTQPNVRFSQATSNRPRQVSTLQFPAMLGQSTCRQVFSAQPSEQSMSPMAGQASQMTGPFGQAVAKTAQQVCKRPSPPELVQSVSSGDKRSRSSRSPGKFQQNIFRNARQDNMRRQQVEQGPLKNAGQTFKPQHPPELEQIVAQAVEQALALKSAGLLGQGTPRNAGFPPRPSGPAGQNIFRNAKTIPTPPPPRMFGQSFENAGQNSTSQSHGKPEEIVSEIVRHLSMSQSHRIPEAIISEIIGRVSTSQPAISKTGGRVSNLQPVGLSGQTGFEHGEQVSVPAPHVPSRKTTSERVALVPTPQPFKPFGQTCSFTSMQGLTPKPGGFSEQSNSNSGGNVFIRQPAGSSGQTSFQSTRQAEVPQPPDNLQAAKLLHDIISKAINRALMSPATGQLEQPMSNTAGQVSTPRSTAPFRQLGFNNDGQASMPQQGGFFQENTSKNGRVVSFSKPRGETGSSACGDVRQVSTLQPDELLKQSHLQNAGQTLTAQQTGFSQNVPQVLAAQPKLSFRHNIANSIGYVQPSQSSKQLGRVTTNNTEAVSTLQATAANGHVTSSGQFSTFQSNGQRGQSISNNAGQGLLLPVTEVAQAMFRKAGPVPTVRQSLLPGRVNFINAEHVLTQQPTGRPGPLYPSNGGFASTSNSAEPLAVITAKNARQETTTQPHAGLVNKQQLPELFGQDKSPYRIPGHGFMPQPNEQLLQTFSKLAGQDSKFRAVEQAGHDFFRSSTQDSEKRRTEEQENYFLLRPASTANGRLGQPSPNDGASPNSAGLFGQPTPKNPVQIWMSHPTEMFGQNIPKNDAQVCKAQQTAQFEQLASNNAEAVSMPPAHTSFGQTIADNNGKMSTSRASGPLGQTDSTNTWQVSTPQSVELHRPGFLMNAGQVFTSLSSGQFGQTTPKYTEPGGQFGQTTPKYTEPGGRFGKTTSNYTKPVSILQPSGLPQQPLSKNVGQVSRTRPTEQVGQNIPVNAKQAIYSQPGSASEDHEMQHKQPTPPVEPAVHEKETSLPVFSGKRKLAPDPSEQSSAKERKYGIETYLIMSSEHTGDEIAVTAGSIARRGWGICCLCSEKFTDVGIFKDHMSSHFFSKPHRCEQCGRTFYSRKGLHIHHSTPSSRCVQSKPKARFSVSIEPISRSF